MGGVVILPDRPNDEAAPGLPEKPGDADHQQDREVNEIILSEQQLADQRQVAQHRDVQPGEIAGRLAGIVLAPQGGDAEAENGQRQPGRDLVGEQRLGQEAEQQRHQRAGRQCGEDAGQIVAGLDGRREAGNGADDHHAFDAEVEHTGLFDHQFADRGEDQRRRGDDDAEQDVDDQLHAALSPQPGAESSGPAPRPAHPSPAGRTAACPGTPGSSRSAGSWRSGPPRRRYR